jgi:uroporphyrinogen decarboxylase
MPLTPKQNAVEILRFGTPEWVAGGLGPQHRTAYFGVDHENAEGGGHDLPVGSAWRDIWGTVWHKEHDGVMGFPREHPLANLADLDAYHWPDPDTLAEPVYTRAATWERDTAFLVGSHRDTLWERAYMLCGMENMLCNFFTEPEATRVLLHRIMDFQLGIARHYLAVGVEIAACGDDLGTQCAPLLSPALVQEFLVPEYRRLFTLYQAHGVIISFHSCGHITPLLETFIDLGINVLNPVQATANDLATVRRMTQGRMALEGGLSSGLLVDGPPARIRTEVRRLLTLLGSHGGYFCAPDQGMPWSEAHYTAYREALEAYGRYPLEET